MFPNKLPLHSGMECRSNPICFRHACSLSGVSTLVSMSDPFFGRVDLRQHELSFLYSLPDPMISPLDMLRPELVGHVLRKVDGTLTVAIESVLFLLDTELTDEVLHP